MTVNYGRALKMWIPGAIMITLVAGFVYCAVQQVYRQSANDPQIQIATEIKNALQNGTLASSFATADKVDLTKSLSSFLTITDDARTIRVSTASLDSENPLPPQGVFDSAKKNGVDKITWEPEKGVRQALVVMYYAPQGGQPGYVLVGRSLKEVEAREHSLLVLTAIFWIITVAAWFILVIWKQRMWAQRMKGMNTAV